LKVIRVRKTTTARVSQGDIIRDVEVLERLTAKSGVVEIVKILFPLVIVLTQDCDLEQDYRFRRKKGGDQDKILFSALVAPLYNAEHLFAGVHLSELNRKMMVINKNRTPGTSLMNNETPRFHYLEFPEPIQVVPSIIDFKHFFSVSLVELKSKKKTNFVCQVSDLFREDISQRFASFLSRIGLPEPSPGGASLRS
jgi:hypothetical protein